MGSAGWQAGKFAGKGLLWTGKKVVQGSIKAFNSLNPMLDMLRNLPDPNDPEQVHGVVRGSADPGVDGFDVVNRLMEGHLAKRDGVDELERSFENTPGLTPTLHSQMQEEPIDEPPSRRGSGWARPVGTVLDGDPNLPLQGRMMRGTWGVPRLPKSSRGNTASGARSSTDP